VTGELTFVSVSLTLVTSMQSQTFYKFLLTDVVNMFRAQCGLLW